MARPRKKIDPALIEKLASIGCSVEEIASQLNVGSATLYRRYDSAIKKGHLLRNITVRQMQWLAAMTGNTTMLIWLGKQYLGQTDKQDIQTNKPELTFGNLSVLSLSSNRPGEANKPN